MPPVPFNAHLLKPQLEYEVLVVVLVVGLGVLPPFVLNVCVSAAVVLVCDLEIADANVTEFPAVTVCEDGVLVPPFAL